MVWGGGSIGWFEGVAGLPFGDGVKGEGAKNSPVVGARGRKSITLGLG